MATLAEKVIPDSPARMGRRPLGETAESTKATQVRFEAAMRERIDAARGKQSMGSFIREAVERELERRGKGAVKP
jgi:hypothetical protein